MSDPHLHSFLADRDAPCPGCGYNLRGAVSDVCPECASRFALGLKLSDPLGKAWVIGLIALVFGAGFFDVVSIAMVVLSIRFGDWPPAGILAPIFGSGVLLTIATIAWLYHRRRILIQPRPRQRRQAAACVLLTLGALGLLAAIIYVEAR